VAKSKDSPALLEIIQRERQRQGRVNLAIPKWWRSDTGGRAQGLPVSEPEAPPPELDPSVAPEGRSVRSSISPAGAGTRRSAWPTRAREVLRRPGQWLAQLGATRSMKATEPPETTGRLLWYADGRVHFSLNVVSVVVALCGIVLIGFASWQLGVKYGLAEAAARYKIAGAAVDEIEQVRRGEPNPAVLVDPAKGISKLPAARQPSRTAANRPVQAAPRREPFRRTPGLNYIIVQYFSQKNRDAWADASDAKAFLADHGIETVIEPTREGCRLVAKTRGFNFKNPKDRAECDRLVRRIQKLGEAYVKMGDYDLRCMVEKAK